jgi:predicted ATPase with chaperone activity
MFAGRPPASARCWSPRPVDTAFCWSARRHRQEHAGAAPARLLPPLDADDALDVASIASVSARGFESCDYGRRPFRAPHHTRLGQRHHRRRPQARPGEVSLAHRGVLFLDELPEFNRACSNRCASRSKPAWLRSRAAALQVDYPARFQLVAAMNPCPVRLPRRPVGQVPLRAAGNRPLSRAHFRAAARSHRP